ncbi:hypothetical protein CEXT_667981 [Caerostris extrusa]|uniref:Uncharacterized protein n=1 Tax=Caerostris extrusa TaxID=172846 RepID=A0AAV4X743_CAEEX|nr:hypothetical protein CEXT_667981 [Caerostris extrusa]
MYKIQNNVRPVANGFARACPWAGMNNLLAPCKFSLELSTREFLTKSRNFWWARKKSHGRHAAFIGNSSRLPIAEGLSEVALFDEVK